MYKTKKKYSHTKLEKEKHTKKKFCCNLLLDLI